MNPHTFIHMNPFSRNPGLSPGLCKPLSWQIHDKCFLLCHWLKFFTKKDPNQEFIVFASMRGTRKCQRGSYFRHVFFFSWWGERGSKYHYKRAIIGLPAKCHLNGVSLVGRWWPNIECWLGSFMIFQGGGSGHLSFPPCPPLWICAWLPW